MFKNNKFFILPNRIAEKRLEILNNQIVANEGSLIRDIKAEKSAFYFLIEDDIDIKTIKNKLPDKNSEFELLKVSWLSQCIKEKKVVATKNYKIEVKSQTKRKIDNVQIESDDDEEKIKPSTSLTSKKSRFVCEISSQDADVKPQQPKTVVEQNQLLVHELKILADGYRSINDKWRALTYEKAIKQLEKHEKLITSKEEARQISGVGDKLADKIMEILQTGHLRKAEAMLSNEKVQVMQLFNEIWGVGPTKAAEWYDKGYRTLEDIKSKAHLSSQQEIGLRHFDDLKEKMPREEATAISAKVIASMKKIKPDLVAVTCGSYRRGSTMCGDVDILITDPTGGDAQEKVLKQLVTQLKSDGFLTDHLTEASTKYICRKKWTVYNISVISYMGVCRLQDTYDRKHRRLDIIAVPQKEYATSILYFTGSAHFNRSIFAKAKSNGWVLNQHGLFKGVMRQAGTKINEGSRIETPNEESIFKELGLEYRKPAERNHL